MGALDPAGHLRTWECIHHRLLLVLMLPTAGGTVLAPLRIAARGESLAGPTFSTAILLPCLGATVAVYLGQPFTMVPHLLASRGMGRWRMAQGPLAVCVGVLMVVPSALLAGGDGERVIQNVGVFTAAGMLFARFVHPIAGVAVPWLWALGALLFGLSYSDLGKPQWAWWSWIIGSEPSGLVGLALAVLATLALAPRLRRRHGQIGRVDVAD